MRNIVLTGFMGAGKSSVGRRLAGRLGAVFIDTDEIVADRAKMPVEDIFAGFGEEYFREMERAVIVEISNKEGCVIAVGGGAIADENNMRNLRKNGVIVYLRATPEEIIRRVCEGEGRPLLSGADIGKTVHELLEKREPLYMRADIVIDTTSKEICNIVDEIENILRNREGCR